MFKIQCDCGKINRVYHQNWTAIICARCYKEIPNPIYQKQRCRETGRYQSVQIDQDTKNEIKRSADLLMMDYQDAVDLFVVSPSRFRQMVLEEHREWIKI